ncbi:MAG: alpha/beta hydrolase [Lachnospiraceae bacterium]|nr:alpha/beta hydrolase [Lachnospiraceae bacterium]
MNPVLKMLYESGNKRSRKLPTHGDLKEYKVDHGALPLPEGLGSELDVYCETGGGHSLMTDIVYPQKGQAGEKLPILVTIHGGALLFGDRKLNQAFRFRMAEHGCLVYSLEYRLLTETDFFGEMSDICHGLQFVKETAAKYHGDTDRIYMMGESAGALLALYAAAMTGSQIIRDRIGVFCPDLKVQGLIFSSGMLYTTHTDYIAAIYKKDLYGERRKDKEFMKYMDPEHPEVMQSLPGICLTTGYGDFLRKMTLRYAKALEKAGHPSLLLDYNDGEKLPHAFVTLLPSLEESMDAIERIHEWIEKQGV